jgi:3-hydroxyisobutyrate dehydrogenase
MSLGFLGTGLMGAPMASRLLDAGYDVIAYNRTAAKLEPLRSAGAAIASSSIEVLQTADAVVTMVTNAEAIAALLLTDDTKAALSGRTIIQMSTIAPQESRDLAKQITAAGAAYLEAPVLGSIPQAKSGSLIVMTGATTEQFATWLPLLKVFGTDPMLIGPVGSAAAMKLAMNQLIGSLTTAFALSLGFVQQEGIDVEQFMSILRQSALYAPTFDKKLERMCDRNFADPNFPSKHLLKDINLFNGAAEAVGLETSLTEGVASVLQATIEAGLADADYSALYAAVNPARS